MARIVELSTALLALPAGPEKVVVWLMAFPRGCCFYGLDAVLSIAGQESMEQAMHRAQPYRPVAARQTALIRAGLALVVIACGLSLRWYGFPLGLPAFAVKYGGSLLWATMVFLLVGVLLPRQSRIELAVIAA